MNQQVPIYEVFLPNYVIPAYDAFSGRKHITDFGHQVPIEIWENRPDFDLLTAPLIKCLQQHFSSRRIGIRMLGSMEHPGKSVEDLIQLVQQKGHDRYDPHRVDDQYENKDLFQPGLFMLEIEIGTYEGLHGEEQIRHAFQSFYLYGASPTKVDIAIIYDLSQIERKELVFAGKKEIGHTFKYPDRKPEALLAIIKLLDNSVHL